MTIDRVVVADDDDVVITADAMKVDSEGDPGFVLSITNKAPGKVYAYSGAGWSVKGSDVDDAVLRTVVDPGQTIEEFMWFDRRDLGGSALSNLADVEGTIVIEDYDTAAIAGEYAFKA